MYKVKAQAKARVHNGQQFNAYWCARLHWPADEPTERLITEEQLKEMKAEEAAGHPIKVISAEPHVPEKDENFIPASAQTVSVQQEQKNKEPSPHKKPWET